MTDTVADQTAVEVGRFYPHRAERVWRALTTPELMAQWLMEPKGFAPVVGSWFTFGVPPMPSTGFSGEVVCQVLSVVTDELLSISWADARSERHAVWTVTWTLKPEGQGTRVLLRHSGFDPDSDSEQRARTIMGKGWLSIADRLGNVLAG
jgi:uncharacterized protein YndB with AHSA1/START domain